MTELSTPQSLPEGRAARMRTALENAFHPADLRIEDDSARHAGHAGAAPGGETHFTVRLTAEAFIGMSRVQRSRAVHLVLEPELAAGLHALSLDLRTPDEKTPGDAKAASQTRHPGAQL